ncbi:MAG TPA: glycosyltransferase [Chitinophagaceae bacterium]|nr:glycosyltransferase [Chitinophagaceae bacterium]
MKPSLDQTPDKKLKILHIIDTLGVGGAEKVLVSTINNLPEFEHHLIYLAGPDDLLDEINENCKVSKIKWNSRMSFIKSIFIVRKYLKKNNINIVHSHLALATIIARLSCSKKIKLFTTIHNRPSKAYFRNNKILKFIEKISYKPRHCIIAVSKVVLQDYQDCIGIKGAYCILYNFVDDKFFSSSIKTLDYQGELKLITVGNLHYQKNYPYLIEVFKNLPQNIQLDVYGWGDLKLPIQTEIDKYGLNIKLCGVSHQIEKTLLGYDAFILASHYEGQPLVVLEAMASGIPVILADIPSLHEVTNDQALFFNNKDPEDLRLKLMSINKYKVELDGFTKLNLLRAKEIATKERYMNELSKIYLSQEHEKIFLFKDMD